MVASAPITIAVRPPPGIGGHREGNVPCATTIGWKHIASRSVGPATMRRQHWNPWWRKTEEVPYRISSTTQTKRTSRSET
jgi:hypothetical protein